MLRDLFERVYVLNLAGRRDRWEAFQARLPEDWPFRAPARVDAVDGRLVPPPTWWRGGPGAWGCYRSHLSLIEHCLNKNVNSLLLIEDDAAFDTNFSTQAEQFFANLPEDWTFVYLGGEHLKQDVRLPRKINEWVYRPFNVNRTHCFALRGRQTMELVYRHLNAFSSWTAQHHIDHHLGELHSRMDRGLYVPRVWLAAQEAGESDVNGKQWPRQYFAGAEALIKPRVDLQMVAVLGQFRGGTSCLSGLLHHLGVNMGSKFSAPNVNNPRGYFEAERLGQICRTAFIEPWLTEAVLREDRVNLLRRWAGDRCAQLRGTTAIAGGKHPTLCLMGSDLMEAWDDPLFIVVDRPLEESVRSMLKTNWRWPEPAIRYALSQLVETRESFLKDFAPRHLRVPFHRVLQHPDQVIDDICEFLQLVPSIEARTAAIAFVKADSSDGLAVPASMSDGRASQVA